MQSFRSLRIVLAVFLFASVTGSGQSARRIRGLVDDASLTTLRGGTHPLAQPAYDQGLVPDSTPASRLLLVLQRSPEADAALGSRIADLHNPASPSYHQWMKPAEVGALYGAADEDVRTISTWLTQHGFSVDKVHAGGTAIEFSGTTGQLRSAFHTEIHRYHVNGVDHVANQSDPQIPSALAPVIAGVASLNDFHAQPNLVNRGSARLDPVTHAVTPLWTYPVTSTGVYFALAPGDFNVQYDVPSTATGSGVTIGIIGASNVELGLVNSYRTVFGLPANTPQVVVDGSDPGENGAATESYLDLEVAGAVAPNASVILYTSASTELSDGLFTAASRAVNDDTADVLSMSYGECEVVLGTSTNTFFRQLWQQAAAQGQTVMVSAGDGGAAGCDNFDSVAEASQGLAVSGFASTPYNVAVGGTDFYYSAYNAGSSALGTQLYSYWNATSSKNPVTSMLQRVPEQPWDNPLGLNAAGADGIGIVAGSGGASIVYSKPSWQTGTGVPADGVRDLPDVSLFAATGANYSFWPICAVNTDCSTTNSVGAVSISGVGGTSASSPAFAGIMALVNQATKSRQGQANYVLYALAAQQPSVFHDVTAGSNKVPCALYYASDPGCVYDGVTNRYDLGYAATTGYDNASGLGSVDVAKLIAEWSSVTFQPTATTLTLGSSSVVHGQPVNVHATVAAASGSGTPTGGVALTAQVSGATAQTGLEDVLTLASGAASTTVANLPGGTYSVAADYTGDGIFAGSHSSASTITVTPEASTTTYPAAELSAYNGKTLAYGSTLYLLAQVAGRSGQGTPTGTATITDSASGSTTFPLNSSGMAEWNTVTPLALGTHSISSSYSGDASFQASSTTSPMTFTIGKGTPYVTIDASASVVSAGSSVTITVFLSAPDPQAAAPSGTVSVELASTGQTLVGTLVATSTSSSAASVTFTNVPAGYLYFYPGYSGDSNWTAITTASSPSYTYVDSIAGSLYPSVTTLTATSSTISGVNGVLNLTGTVSDSAGIVPSGTVSIYANGELFAEYGIGYTTSPQQTFTLSVPGYYFANGTLSLVATYSGNPPIAGSSSVPLTLTANVGDFSITPSASTFNIASGSSTVAGLSLTSLGLSGAVTLTCSTSSPSIACAVPVSAPLLASYGQTATSVTLYASNVAAVQAPVSPFNSAGRGIVAAATLCLLLLPVRRRLRPVLLTVALGCFAMLLTACGGSGGPAVSTTPVTPVTPVNAPQSTYNVTVTATAQNTSHNVRLTVNVQ